MENHVEGLMRGELKHLREVNADMLAALQLFVKAQDEMRLDYLADATIDARAAIAKATGGTD